ncbi:MAG: DUF3159 domain-containing protein [Anaerolineales bacterium]|nr:DUF3159 domain-containing protein [Anaerolineales bacterium]
MVDNKDSSGLFGEISEELRTVMAGRGRWLDTLFPPIAFLLLNAVAGSDVALLGSLATAALITVFRLVRRESVLYALGGVGGVAVAVLLARLVGGAEGFFLPGILSGVLTVILCLVSVIIRRPLVAWTSYLVRRWPRDWYWHPRVRPAYSEVTLAWVLFFAARTILQLNFFQLAAVEALGVLQLLSGWPATILLLILSYIYGTWRLRNLAGPSVEEFKAGVEPPWEGQRRGF